MVEWLAFGIGLAGLILAASSLLWQRHTYIQTRTESAEAENFLERNERGTFLGINVLNTGVPPLYIKEVILIFKYFEDKKIPLTEGYDETILLEDHCNFVPETREEGPLQPHDCRKYLLQDEMPLKIYASQDPEAVESVYISVRTAKGEVCRIEKEDVLPFFQNKPEQPGQ